MLCNRKRDSDDINLLERISADKRTGNIARDCDKRHRIEIGVCDTCYKICSAGTRGCKHYARFACRAGIAFCRMSGALFVSGQNVLYLIAVIVQLIINVKHLTARIAENGIDALLNECFE